MAKWCDEGEDDVLDVYFSNDQAHRTSLWVGLYKDSTEPAEGATIATITEETGSGYARQEITDAQWTVGAGPTATAVQVTFAATGDWTGAVRGYFLTTVVTPAAGLLLAVEHFPDPGYTVTNGGSVKVTCKVTAS